MMMKPEDKDRRIAALEKQVAQLEKEIRSLLKSLSYIERENNRRKSEIQILAARKNAWK